MIDKSNIIEVSANLFKTYGIRSVSMDDIAREVGASKKTLYQYVTDKEHIIKGIVDFEYHRVEAELLEAKNKSEDLIEQLFFFNGIVLNFLKEINPAAVNDLNKFYSEIYIAWRKKYSEQFKSFLAENIIAGKRTGLYIADLNEAVITDLHSDRIELLLTTNRLWNNKNQDPELLKDIITYYIRGLITEKAEPLLNKHLNNFEKYIK